MRVRLASVTVQGWTVSTFSGGAGSVVLLATVTHLIRVTQIAPVVTLASLMASP
jgi:hypothetical protein